LGIFQIQEADIRPRGEEKNAGGRVHLITGKRKFPLGGEGVSCYQSTVEVYKVNTKKSQQQRLDHKSTAVDNCSGEDNREKMTISAERELVLTSAVSRETEQIFLSPASINLCAISLATAIVNLEQGGGGGGKIQLSWLLRTSV